MVQSHRAAALVTLPIEEVSKRLGDQLQRWNFAVHHVEELHLVGPRKGMLVFGTSSPLRGAGLLAFLFQGARYVPFLVRGVQTGPDETELVVAAAGAEYWIPTDWGRNRNIVELILSQFPGRPIDPPPLTEEREEEEGRLEWRDSAPGL